jgi:hypothetical protein
MLNPKDGYSTDVIRSKLTRDVAVTFKDVREELVMAMDDLILACEDSTWQSSTTKKGYSSQHAEWVKVPIIETIQRVVCRTTNRIFVGAPLCP